MLTGLQYCVFMCSQLAIFLDLYDWDVVLVARLMRFVLFTYRLIMLCHSVVISRIWGKKYSCFFFSFSWAAAKTAVRWAIQGIEPLKVLFVYKHGKEFSFWAGLNSWFLGLPRCCKPSLFCEYSTWYTSLNVITLINGPLCIEISV